MLSEVTKQKIDEVVALIAAEGHTVCGCVISEDGSAITPFSNLDTTAEFVYNQLSAAGMVADTIGADVTKIVEAQENFQKQFIKINEA